MNKLACFFLPLVVLSLCWGAESKAASGERLGMTMMVKVTAEGSQAQKLVRMLEGMLNAEVNNARTGFDLLSGAGGMAGGMMGDMGAGGLPQSDIQIQATLKMEAKPAPLMQLRIQVVEVASGLELAALAKDDRRNPGRLGMTNRIMSDLMKALAPELVAALKNHSKLVMEKGRPLRIEFINPPAGSAPALKALVKNKCACLSDGSLPDGKVFVVGRCAMDLLDFQKLLDQMIENDLGNPEHEMLSMHGLFKVRFEQPKKKSKVRKKKRR